MFGLFDAFKIGAAGGVHSGVAVGVFGEFVEAGCVVEGEAERGEQG